MNLSYTDKTTNQEVRERTKMIELNNTNNNMRIYKAHNVNTQAESEALVVARWG